MVMYVVFSKLKSFCGIRGSIRRKGLEKEAESRDKWWECNSGRERLVHSKEPGGRRMK